MLAPTLAPKPDPSPPQKRMVHIPQDCTNKAITKKAQFVVMDTKLIYSGEMEWKNRELKEATREWEKPTIGFSYSSWVPF